MYEIANYDELYRPYDKSGGELANPSWVKMPAKPKGEGLCALLEHKRGLEVFAVWGLLLQKTTIEKKPENRGKLLNHREQPATVSEIAKGISLKGKEKLVEYALSILTTIGWLNCDSEQKDNSEVNRKPFPQTSAKSSVVYSSVDKSKYSDSFLNFWKAFKGRWNIDKGRFDKGGKREAFDEWERLILEQQELAKQAAPKTGDKSTQDGWRWLKNHRWEDFEEKPIDQKRESLEKTRQRIRDSEGEYYAGKSKKELKELLKCSKLVHRHWLIKEILEGKEK